VYLPRVVGGLGKAGRESESAVVFLGLHRISAFLYRTSHSRISNGSKGNFRVEHRLDPRLPSILKPSVEFRFVHQRDAEWFGKLTPILPA
jgi:hypothetical protein